ncbi:uncharacterized protein LOC101204674 [Cucumis sativus]|uniref:Uncharacterized protein n=1 Tax=Cucumis sativus TaxID=3659 RepID=A0A0A0L525_CUCSA|nr:uncharacterized protein LOC101204674 [Cucumis sativus]KGN57035.1 hypothetical protein Csa_010259 [Cucumis sativus]
MDDGRSPACDRNDIRLQISETCSGNTTMFEPRGASITMRESSSVDFVSPMKPVVRAPEKKLTLFALRLAVLEKAATGLGTLGFIWATVVLLGGFAITLDKTDFWFITIILLIEGTRIFSRSHELEWQHQATWSIADAGLNSFRALRTRSQFLVRKIEATFKSVLALGKQSRGREIRGNSNANDRGMSEQSRMPTRQWSTPDVPLLPYAQWVFLSKNISKLLYWLQLISATACVVLSLMKLIKHNYGNIAKGDMDKRNRRAALSIFYGLALAEALLFLIEKAYWEWKVIFRKLLEKVNIECELGPLGMISTKRFFYDAYSRCVNGSIFDGLKMDMISFAMELLDSSFPDEQLIGVRILRQFSMNQRFSNDTLEKIGVNLAVIERLVEMLNWKDPQEEEIRLSAAEILSKLAGKKQNSLRVAGIPGAMESISSLLHNGRSSNVSADEISEKKIIHDRANYSFWTFNHLGLVILKKLARDHDNCGKIGNTRGLLPKIIDFTHAEERLLKDEHVAQSQIQTVKRSLQVVKMLASTTGTTGKFLRNEIAEIVFTISNIRDVLRYGDKHPSLQKLGIEILTSLALDEDATESIGGTGSVLKELFRIFFNQEMGEIHNRTRIAAGEALAMLALDSKSNCNRILKLEVQEKLVTTLEIPLLRVNAARILRNLCVYSGPEGFDKLRGVAAAASTVIRAIKSEDQKLQEVMIGLAAQILKFTTSHEAAITFERAGTTQAELAATLVQILKKHKNPPTKTPQIRRFVIEMAIWMMREKTENVHYFEELGMGKELETVLETTAELESFNIFSGTVGLSRHRMTMHSLAEIALGLLGRW